MTCLLSCLVLLPSAPMPPAVATVFVNGRVWTVNRAQPEAEALAVSNGRIVAVGTTEEIKRLAGPATRVVDLAGRRVVPGFHDSHVHLLGSGLRLAEGALKDAKASARSTPSCRATAGSSAASGTTTAPSAAPSPTPP